MAYSFLPAFLSLIFVVTSTAYPQITEMKPAPAIDERLSRDTPEGTLRLFTLGVLLTNEQLIKATMVPVSEEDFAYLMQETKNLRSSPKELKEDIAKMKVRALKPGDVVTLPGGTKVTVTQEEVTEDRMVLVLADSPIPTRLYKAQGYWWVDADPVIAGRKAAAKLSKGQKTVSPQNPGSGDAKADSQSLEGTWEVVSIKVSVEKVHQAMKRPDELVIRDGKLTFFNDGKELPNFKHLKMELSTQKGRLDLVRGETETLPCLYEATADELKLAMPLIPENSKPEEPLSRPESFDSKDKPVVVLTAKRSKE